ncbi:MAG TPA: hypothetical protein PK289_03265 [Bacteroidia bacterium]|nr:hypothetical protein [Bacteroidia bacterium]HRG52402.1 hypothetical protein [Bacteroidia bacterium]
MFHLFGCSLLMNGQSGSNATVTIIGGDAEVENSNPGPPSTLQSPPVNGAQLAEPQNIEPTLENSFHIRYRIDTPQKQEETQAVTEYASISAGGVSISSGSSSGTKAKRRRIPTMTERTFNFKKRYRAWMPKHKKKYRPNVCGRF